jgi:hypothetical protein
VATVKAAWNTAEGAEEMTDTKSTAPVDTGAPETSVEPSGPTGSPVPSNVPPGASLSGGGKLLYYKKGGSLHGSRAQLVCCVCGEDDREKLAVEELGLAAGMRGDDYTFCHRCWYSKTLGKKILSVLGYSHGLKLIDSAVEVVEVK